MIVPAASSVFAWLLAVLPCGKENVEDDMVNDVDKNSLLVKTRDSLADELAN